MARIYKYNWPFRSFTFIVIALISGSCFCQTTSSHSVVRQGTMEDLNPPDYSTDYMSPMVFEYNLSKLNYVPIKKGKSQYLVVNDFIKYECEKVVLEKLQIARRDSDDSEKRELVIVAHLFTKPPKDKLVTIRFDLIIDGKPIAGNIVRNVSVEEGYHIPMNTVVSYPKGIIETSPTAVLKIVMSVDDDNL